MFEPTELLGLSGYTAACAAYLVFALVVCLRPGPSLQTAALALGCAVTGAWAGVIAYGYWTGSLYLVPARVLDLLKPMAWLLFVWLFSPGRPKAVIAVTGTALLALAGETLFRGLVLSWSESSQLNIPILLRISFIVLILIVLENVYRNFDRDDRWKVKFYCIGLASLFTFDLYYYSSFLLVGSRDITLYHARGAIYLLIVPLLVISTYRSRLWTGALRLSHQGVFYSTAIVAAGGYLVLMSVAGFYLPYVGGTWGSIIQWVFLFGAVVLLSVIFASGSLRAYLKVFVGKHFFRYKYDYRSEWLRFTKTIARGDESVPLEHRVILSIANLVESPAGALWLKHGGQFAIAGAWNMAAPSLSQAEAGPLADILERSRWVLEVDNVEQAGAKYGAVEIPQAIKAIPDAWIIVPLFDREALSGFALLSRPRAPRALDWEDYDLLRTVGQQAASYLAQKQAAGELAHALQFERFNRRAAFVIHDIKNLVSQLSLLCSNIEKHGDKAEFRSDLTDSIQGVSGRMRNIVERLTADGGWRLDATRTPVGALLEAMPLLRDAAQIEVSIGGADRGFALAGDAARLTSILDHILDNAVAAVGADGWVRLSFHANAQEGVFEITDNGPGMDVEFVRAELFKPFRTTKPGGLGLGLYQCREYARELGGDVTVVSSPGAGTTVRVVLPGDRAGDRAGDLAGDEAATPSRLRQKAQGR